MFGKYLDNVRSRSPLIHNITNYVTINDVANILLACQSRPMMSDSPVDIEEITSIADGLTLNLGMLGSEKLDSMLLAGKKARELGHTILLDPVGVGASSFRLEAAQKIIKEVRPDAIRGNFSEIRMLISKSHGTNGVDADRTDTITETNTDKVESFVMQAARETRCIVAVTGAIDFVSDGKTCIRIYNGRPEMSSVTGTGCQLSALITAFTTANPDQKLFAAAAAVCAMGAAGEIAWERMQNGDGNATYRNRIIDAIYTMDGKILDQRARFEIEERD